MQSIVAFVGVSGVGKSTLLKKLSECCAFQHLQASALIAEMRSAEGVAKSSSDHLRLANIDENQELLTRAFHVKRNPEISLIIIDGHTLIDTPSGLIDIGAPVFAELGVTQFVFLADDPQSIFERRLRDQTRNRPKRSVEELDHQQTQALLSAFRASVQLNVPLQVFTPSQFDAIREAMEIAGQVSTKYG